MTPIQLYRQQYNTKNKKKIAQQKKEWSAKNWLSRVNSDFKRHYGKSFNWDVYYNMLQGQDSACKICGVVPDDTRLCVDHCHTSGNVRFLLCDFCNTALGLMNDNPTLLEKAAKYVKGELN